MTPICNECGYCECTGRSRGTWKTFGRREFMCEHPDARARCAEVSNRLPGFLGWSKDGEIELNMKTSPRWCPRRKG